MCKTKPKKRNARLLAGWLLMTAALPSTVEAAVVSFEAVDLADVVAGQDLWQYRYRVSDYDFKADEGFTIFFDYHLYGSLDPEGTLTAPNGDWDVLAIDPDKNLPDDGFFDALALRAGASVAEPFTVSFIWMGGGVPGSQPFEIYDSLGAIILGGKNTRPVPIPGTALLLAGGIAALFGATKKGRRDDEE